MEKSKNKQGKERRQRDGQVNPHVQMSCFCIVLLFQALLLIPLFLCKNTLVWGGCIKSPLSIKSVVSHPMPLSGNQDAPGAAFFNQESSAGFERQTRFSCKDRSISHFLQISGFSSAPFLLHLPTLHRLWDMLI